ncbi:hypothetical protein VTK56DRAFT_8540 [Thermocarpiscus australiensis]
MGSQVRERVLPSKVWASLITNIGYLPGLLALEYSLRRVQSRYPLVALYTDQLPEEGRRALEERAISTQRVEYLIPRRQKDYSNDPRFYDCWTKLTVFSLVQYERVVLLDADMLVVQNMDELMDLDLDGDGSRAFAASYACLCNPLKKPHYPKDWAPENCPYTWQHSDPEAAQTQAAPLLGAPMPNSGLVVLNPSIALYDKITEALADEKTSSYVFPDQALLGDVFAGNWFPLPYVYNGLKTMRRPGVHDAIWRDDRVKNIHYILVPKPWQAGEDSDDELVRKWQVINDERLQGEERRGIVMKN